MALLNSGYWATTYWASRYWQEDYWAEYGLVLGGDSSRYYYYRKKKQELPQINRELLTQIHILLTALSEET